MRCRCGFDSQNNPSTGSQNGERCSIHATGRTCWERRKPNSFPNNLAGCRRRSPMPNANVSKPNACVILLHKKTLISRSMSQMQIGSSTRAVTLVTRSAFRAAKIFPRPERTGKAIPEPKPCARRPTKLNVDRSVHTEGEAVCHRRCVVYFHRRTT